MASSLFLSRLFSFESKNRAIHFIFVPSHPHPYKSYQGEEGDIRRWSKKQQKAIEEERQKHLFHFFVSSSSPFFPSSFKPVNLFIYLLLLPFVDPLFFCSKWFCFILCRKKLQKRMDIVFGEGRRWPKKCSFPASFENIWHSFNLGSIFFLLFLSFFHRFETPFEGVFLAIKFIQSKIKNSCL